MDFYNVINANNKGVIVYDLSMIYTTWTGIQGHHLDKYSTNACWISKLCFCSIPLLIRL
jgi:hypothetical protein